MIPDPTGQSQELGVKDQLLIFQLDLTVNEVETFSLRKVSNVGKWVSPILKPMIGCSKLVGKYKLQRNRISLRGASIRIHC